MEDRINLIARMIDSSVRKPQKNNAGQQYMLRDFVLRDVVNGTSDHGLGAEKEEVLRVFKWVKGAIQYKQDPRDYDYYAAAGRTINARGGDCDDHTILICAMLSSIGYVTGAKVVAGDGKSWHIYALVGLPRANPTYVLALDTTQPGSFVGWEPDLHRHRAYEIQTTFDRGRHTPIRKNRWAGISPTK
jgi:hypothetical protein